MAGRDEQNHRFCQGSDVTGRTPALSFATHKQNPTSKLPKLGMSGLTLHSQLLSRVS